jgi:hypothetical protein
MTGECGLQLAGVPELEWKHCGNKNLPFALTNWRRITVRNYMAKITPAMLKKGDIVLVQEKGRPDRQLEIVKVNGGVDPTNGRPYCHVRRFLSKIEVWCYQDAIKKIY